MWLSGSHVWSERHKKKKKPFKLLTKAFNKTYQKKEQNRRLGLWQKKGKKKRKKQWRRRTRRKGLRPVKLWQWQRLSCINIHQYFWLKFSFFFFFFLLVDFLFPARTHWYLADTIWFSANQPGLAWIGTCYRRESGNEKKKKSDAARTRGQRRHPTHLVLSRVELWYGDPVAALMLSKFSRTVGDVAEKTEKDRGIFLHLALFFKAFN